MSKNGNRLAKLEDDINSDKKFVVLCSEDERKVDRNNRYKSLEQKKLEDDPFRNERWQINPVHNYSHAPNAERSKRLTLEAIENYKKNNDNYPGQFVVAMPHIAMACL